MAAINYTKQNFVDGNVLHASELNNIETGIYNNSNIVSNPNLLDNPFFTVNNRNFTSGSGYGYTVDRWKNNSTSGNQTITLNSNGSITCNATVGTGYFRQEINPLTSKTYTLSINVISVTGTCYIRYIDLSETYHSATIGGVGIRTYTFTDAVKTVYICINTGGSITFNSLKLEEGSFSTLANDIPPNYEVECFKCMTSTADDGDTYANMGIGVIKEYTTTVPTTGWNEYSTYASLTININNILSADTPIIDIDTSGSHNISDYVNWKENFAKILKISTSNGSITILAESKFTYSVPIKILCIRK